MTEVNLNLTLHSSKPQVNQTTSPNSAHRTFSKMTRPTTPQLKPLSLTKTNTSSCSKLKEVV